MEQTGGKGADVVFDNVGDAVMADSLSCTAYNGRYLMMGFASDKTVADEKSIVPRSIALANIKLCGVLLSYADAEFGAAIKQAMGWNFPSNELGAEIMQQVLDLVRKERVRAVVGPGGRLRRRARRLRGDGQPRDRRPHDREALAGLTGRPRRRDGPWVISELLSETHDGLRGDA